MKKRRNVILVLAISTLFFEVQFVNAKEFVNNNIFYFEEVVNAGKDTGYSKKTNIKKDDPHYGWKLGKFAISGFSGKSKDNEGNLVLLKNVGDKITLYFNLMQDINKLDGNKNLLISTDKNGYDNEFNIKQTNFGKGTLIIRKIDASGNKNEPQIYRDYLNGVKVGANTKIEVFEEGDYEVALDYEIIEARLMVFNSYHNYRIRFNFSVRNGNCMVFPFDVKTKSELVNTSITENGFYLDFANSKYLNVNIKKEVLKDGVNGLVEDTRFNRPAKSGEEYIEEGIYTITAKNEYTNEQTIKKIYVGKDNILKAHVQTGYSISDVRNMVKLGAKIDDNGNINNIPKDYLTQDNNSNFVTLSDLDSNKMVIYFPIIIPIILIFTFIVLKGNQKKKENIIVQKKIDQKKKNKLENIDDEEENIED